MSWASYKRLISLRNHRCKPLCNSTSKEQNLLPTSLFWRASSLLVEFTTSPCEIGIRVTRNKKWKASDVSCLPDGVRLIQLRPPSTITWPLPFLWRSASSTFKPCSHWPAVDRTGHRLIGNHWHGLERFSNKLVQLDYRRPVLDHTGVEVKLNHTSRNDWPCCTL